MSLIEWNEETLGVDVELIDNQHKMLIHLINKLAITIEKNEDSEVIESIFSQLVDYTQYHFNTEETYFFRLNNKDTELHILQHHHFIEQLSQFKKKHRDLTKVSTELLNFLSDWLSNHIQIEDKKFVKNNLKA
ncbi:MAG: hemerythrin family protein [Colwelliaceae bacterium]|nr:hemerythrin family protein [Colwelliaceae bacterium]